MLFTIDVRQDVHVVARVPLQVWLLHTNINAEHELNKFNKLPYIINTLFIYVSVIIYGQLNEYMQVIQNMIKRLMMMINWWFNMEHIL